MKKQGYILLTAVFVIVFFSLIGLVVVSLVSSQALLAQKNVNSTQAFQVAEAGIAFYANTSLEGDSDWTDNPAITKNFGPGSFTVTFDPGNNILGTLESTGTVSGISRTVRQSFQRSISGGLGTFGDFAVYSYGAPPAGEDTDIGDNVTINGSLLVSADLNLGDNTVVTGDATSTGDITGGEVAGEVVENSAPPDDPPSLDTTYYDNLISTAEGYLPANMTYNNFTFSGTTYVHGNITINNNAIISTSGNPIVVATGTVTIGNNVDFGNNLTVVAGGAISMGNNVDIGSNGLWFSSVSITIVNNSEIAPGVTAGAGTSFITPGNLSLGNNAVLFGFVFAEGSVSVGNNAYLEGNILAGYIDSIGNNSEITLNNTLVNFNNINGLNMGSAANLQFGPSEPGLWQEMY